MRLIVSEEIAASYPGLRIGVLVARGVHNRGEDERLKLLKVVKAAQLRRSLTPEGFITHPHIKAWREVYRSFGVNPKQSTPTAEALIRRVLKGGQLPTISKIVDLYLVAETEFLLPVGGYDLDRAKEPLMLRYSQGGESFVPLGASQSEELTRPGEVIYADAARVLTRKWNFRDCDFCKITEESTNIALFTEAATARVSTEQLENLVERMRSYVLEFCGGEVRVFTASVAERLEWSLD